MPPLLTSAVVKSFPKPVFKPFRFEGYYSGSKKYWQAVCPFELNIELDKNLDALTLTSIEYRQYIAGGVWVAMNDEEWEAQPNGNEKFRIPAYTGQQKVAQLPMLSVSGVGLSRQHWKEDGEVQASGPPERYGYRATATMDTPREADLWYPRNTVAGHRYLLRDTPSVRGRWYPDTPAEKLPIWVWIEIFFRGCVVQVENFGNTTRPIKLLAEQTWKAEWLNAKLNLFSEATPIARPADHVD